MSKTKIKERLAIYDEPRCGKCGGVLVGSEKRHGTCGFCGKRYLRPKSLAGRAA